MRAFRWIMIAGVGVVILAALAIAAGAAWLNTYIQTDAFRHEVETRAGQSLGGTVQIETINFDIFNGVKLSGLVTQMEPGNYRTMQIKIEKVECAYSWTELLNRRLKLTGITIDKPQIVLTIQPTPPLVPTEPAPTTSATTSSPDNSVVITPAPAPTPVSPGAPVTAPASGQGISVPFQFILDRAKINDGTVSVLDANGTSLVELQGVNADANTSGYVDGKDVTGTLHIADLALPSNMHVTDFSTPFTYGQGTLYAKPFIASAFSGNLAGDYQLEPTGPSIFNLNAKGIDVAQLTSATSSKSKAKLSGTLDLQSKWRGIESGDINGEGDAQLVNGKLTGVKILHDLSKIFHVKELDAPVITKAQTHFLVQNQVTNIIGLQLESPIFKITGDGTIGFNGALNANLVLILTRDAMAKLPSEAAASFVQQQDGSGSIAFTVTGTTSNPQTDLVTRLLLQNNQLNNIINNALNKFFH